MSKKLLMVLLVAVTAVVSLAVIVGCSSKPANLEEYFKAHESEWNDAVAQIVESGGDVLDVEMTVEENTINQIMTYKTTYPAAAVEQMKTAFAGQEEALLSSLSEQIKSIEKETGFDISWYFEYRNGDGSPIYSMTATG